MEYDKDILERTGIFVFRNAVKPELCTRTIERFYSEPKKHIKGLTGGGYNPSFKNTTDWYVRDDLESIYYSVLNLALQTIEKLHTNLKGITYKWSGLQFQKNEKGTGFFKWHSDNNEVDPECARFLAPIFYLNDVDEGGETEFMYQNISIKPEKGTLVIFPSTWTYYHRGVTPVSNDKYIITSFMLVPRT